MLRGIKIMHDKRKVNYEINLKIKITAPFEGYEDLKSGIDLAGDIVELICDECARADGEAHCTIENSSFRVENT